MKGHKEIFGILLFSCIKRSLLTVQTPYEWHGQLDCRKKPPTRYPSPLACQQWEMESSLTQPSAFLASGYSASDLQVCANKITIIQDNNIEKNNTYHKLSMYDGKEKIKTNTFIKEPISK